jgi:hypothetical protein
MNAVLPTPTAELVRAAGEDSNRDAMVIEQALNALFSQYPGNGDLCHVLLKVVTLNALYSTHIPIYSMKIPTVEDVARHIHQNAREVDSALAAGSPEIVDRISRVTVSEKKDRIHFSFATKYCSWHNPTAYPIYDANAEACLWCYRKQDGFATFHREGYDYTEFVRIVRAFRDFPLYGLGAFTFKEIDKFLWLYGGKLSSLDRTPTETDLPASRPGAHI